MKKKIFPLICLLICIVLLSITGAELFRLYIGKFHEVIHDTEYEKYYVMITEDSKSSFWRSIYNGAYEKGIEENAYVELLGDKLGEKFSREDLMRIAITSKADGIIINADETKEMSLLIDEATKAGIPVVTLYNDNTQSSRCSFVGIGSYNLGVEYGRKVLEIVREGVTANVAVLVNPDTYNTSQNVFCSAIQETVERNANKKINLSLVSVNNTNTFAVEESIRDLFMKEELPDIIICLNELNTTCVYQAIIDHNKVGQVHVLGYYDSYTILNAIDKGVIDATASVDTKQMGEFCIQALSEYHEYGNTSQYFTADIAFIHRLNVKKYIQERAEK